MKKSILITGGMGYIAQSILNGLKTHDITAVDRTYFDLTHQDATNEWFKDKHFDIVVHTATKGGRRLVKDNAQVTHDNLLMFLNLLNNKQHFGKLISFGSGAELNRPVDPYGVSKNIISELIKNEPNFYNIRIFGVFDENESEERFIISNIKRYINKKPMIIHEDKLMDFFYMKDLVSLVKFYIETEQPPKFINCSYKRKHKLSGVANMINKLDSHRVRVNIHAQTEASPYIGPYTELPIKPRGIKAGIRQTFNIIKNQ